MNSHYEEEDETIKRKDEELNSYFAELAPVPFIISPNVHHFVGSIGLTGLFNSANLAAVLALANPDVMVFIIFISYFIILSYFFIHSLVRFLFLFIYSNFELG